MRTYGCQTQQKSGTSLNVGGPAFEEFSDLLGKRRRRSPVPEHTIATLDDAIYQQGCEDAAYTDTSLASTLTRESLTELQMQSASGEYPKGDAAAGTATRRPVDAESAQRCSLLEYSVLQQLELLDELLGSLGLCYPRWKHRRFGLQRFYCHKFNIHLDSVVRENYVKLLSNMWDGFESTGINRWSSNNMWLQLLTQEYQVHRAKQSRLTLSCEYSNSKRVEEVLQQLDEITSCFCTDRCAMDFMRHSSYWGPAEQTTVTQDDEPVKRPIGECFASAASITQSAHASRIRAIVSFYEERGIIHNFTRPYEYGVQVTHMPPFRRSVVCLSCGRVCWCHCQRKLFRTYCGQKTMADQDTARSSPGTSEGELPEEVEEDLEMDLEEGLIDEEDEEVTVIHEFVNKLQHKKQSLHPHIAQTAITVAHARKLDCGVIHCYHSNGGDDGLEAEQPTAAELKQQLLRATVLRGGLEDLFAAITPRLGCLEIANLRHDVFQEWRNVPAHRSWRRCWWRLVERDAVDTSDDNVRPFVSQALERLDALGNVRYNLEYGYVAVGCPQKRGRACSYWRHFYVSQLGLWRAFTKAAEYNLMVCTLPLEMQLDSKSMHWTVCKCHQGDMYRKSFSTLKRGVVLGYAMAIQWYEKLLQDLNGTSAENSDFEDESDVGCDDFDEQLLLKQDDALYAGVNTVEHAFLAARKRKIVLSGERGFSLPGLRSDGSVLDVRSIANAKEKLLLDHNLWCADLRDLFPDASRSLLATPDPSRDCTLRNLLAHYPDLRDYFSQSLKHLDECVYTLKMCVNNCLSKGSMDLVEPILQLNDDKKLADVIPQVPMQWVSFHRNSDSWACVLECDACVTCAPRACLKQDTCSKFKNGKEVVDLLCKKFRPCSVKYSAHPFHKDGPGNTSGTKGASDNCCTVGFSAQKFGFNGAKALATEFRKRYIQIVYSSMKYDGSFSDALLGMIAEEIGLLTSTDAYILPDQANDEQRKNLLEALTCDVCSTFGDRMRHRNGTVLLKQLVKSSVPGKRLSEVFALGQMAEAILLDVKLDIKFCTVHMAWVVWWLDCMQQKRVMFYRVEDLINVTNLEEALATLDKHWMDAVSAHVEHAGGLAAERYQMTLTYRFEEAFHHLTCLQKNLYNAFHTAFAMALRAITDSRQEFKLIKRLWQINNNSPGDVVAQDINAKSFALADTVLFPFGSLHDEGTPPLSDAE
ncbi:AP2 domain transcription factor ap2viia-5 [Babesia caballi]|uniref:AP2 domain transcription factor ap2viia-5 n=1 Tax=Babesia caballi TaxID=5871 RepID=A0AAV4LN92_BABCB|nr:AP2 domain transcription factor ap2viia-5 [Babesia caballi]